MKPINLLIVFGGKSNEHSVSVWSANNIIKALDKNKYILTLVYIDKKGNWYLLPNNISIDEKIIKQKLNSLSNGYLILKDSKGYTLNLKTKKTKSIDVCFPILHGLNGEDGTIQGLLKTYNIKCVGCDVLSSSINMDKVIQKKLLKASNIKTSNFISIKKTEIDNWNFKKIQKILKIPFFVKPANTGSSVGISKVYNDKEFKPAIVNAFKHDKKIIIEEYISGKEIECSIIGNSNVFTSLPGQVIPKDEFYTYDDKYIKSDGAELVIPVNLPKKVTKAIQNTAMYAYLALECSGFARVDMFLTDKNEIYVNELNTIPGFTNISMFPKLWECTGLKYTQLINLLINLALKY